VYTRYRAEIHAYCLIGQSLPPIRTPEANLQRLMRHVNGLYTQYFNRTEGKDGALFGGRYKAILVDAGRTGIGKIFCPLYPTQDGAG